MQEAHVPNIAPQALQHRGAVFTVADGHGASVHWPVDAVHCEQFVPPTYGPFSGQGGTLMTVQGMQPVLHVLFAKVPDGQFEQPVAAPLAANFPASQQVHSVCGFESFAA